MSAYVTQTTILQKHYFPDYTLKMYNIRFMFQNIFDQLKSHLVSDELKAINYFLDEIKDIKQVKNTHLIFTKDTIKIWINIDDKSLDLREDVYDLISTIEDKFNIIHLDFMVFNRLKNIPTDSYMIYGKQ